MKLMDIKEITGKIVLKSGLHIGAGDTQMHIGGTDNPVVKHPYTQEPYIPGSSIKGKVRSLLEMRSGLMINTKGKPLQAGDLKNLDSSQRAEAENILKLFGSSGADNEEIAQLGPTRVSFADCPLSDEWKKKAKERQLNLTEVKSENSIDRIKGTAEHPRFTERVPSDTEFAFSVSVKIMEEDQDLFDYLLEGLKLLEMDSLGGNGSRGYGRIKFEFDDKDIEKQFNTLVPFDNTGEVS